MSESAKQFWTFEYIAQCARCIGSGVWVSPPTANAELRWGAAIDTREIKPGQVFFALPGERADGRSFLKQAQKNGAALAIVSNDGLARFEIPERLAVLEVDNPEEAFAALAEAYRARFVRTQVIGVTGSNGKTTTVRLIDSVLRAGGLNGTHAQKSFNNHLGLPLTLLNANPNDDYVVCEMGTSSPGEIGFLTQIARPDISVIVSIAPAHLEKLGSVDGVAQEKAHILFKPMTWPRGSHGVIPAGVAELESVIKNQGPADLPPLIRVGEHPNADRRVMNIATSIDGTTFELRHDEEPAVCWIPLLGAHNAHNAAIATTVGELCGVSEEQIIAGLAAAPGAEMRLDRRTIELEGGSLTILNDAYNANPESTRAGLRTLSSIELPAQAPGRRVAVLGDLLEMGELAEAVHREMVREVAAQVENGSVSLAVLVGSNYAKAAQRAGVQEGFAVFADHRDETIEAVSALLEPGDLVLLKASRGLRLERLMDTFAPAAR